MNDYNFGNFIYVLREQKGYTQADIASMLGVTAAAVSKWENGESKPRIETLFKLADILEVKTEELIAGRRLENERLDPEVVDKIYQRYDLLTKVDSGNTFVVKIKRIVAFLLDWNILGFSVMLPLSFIMISINKGNTTIGALLFLGMILLYPVCVALRDVIFGGRSLGKRIMGLVVVDKATGEKPNIGKLILRGIFFFLMYIDGIILLVSGKSVGDIVAGTVVIPKKVGQAEDFDKTDSAKIKEINTYKPPKDKSHTKIILLVVGIIAMFVAVIIIIVISALNAAKKTEEYAIAYSYLVNSDEFKESGASVENIRLNGYSSTQSVTDNGTIKQTTFTFYAEGESYEISLVYRDNVWIIDKIATTF